MKVDHNMPVRRRGKKSVNWDRDPEILARLDSVAQMLVRGARAWQVAEALGTSMSTANRDIKRVRLLWSREAKRAVEECRQQSLAQIRSVQQQAWSSYDKEKNALWLRLILDCERDIVALEGTSAPSGLDIKSGGQPITITTIEVVKDYGGESVSDS